MKCDNQGPRTVGSGIIPKELKKDLKFSLGRSKSGASTTHPEIPSRKSNQNVEMVRVEMAVEASQGSAGFGRQRVQCEESAGPQRSQMTCRREGSLERSQGEQEQRGNIRRMTGRMSDVALHLSDTQGRVGPPSVRAGSRGGSYFACLLLGPRTLVRLTRSPSAPLVPAARHGEGPART